MNQTDICRFCGEEVKQVGPTRLWVHVRTGWAQTFTDNGRERTLDHVAAPKEKQQAHKNTQLQEVRT